MSELNLEQIKKHVESRVFDPVVMVQHRDWLIAELERNAEEKKVTAVQMMQLSLANDTLAAVVRRQDVRLERMLNAVRKVSGQRDMWKKRYEWQGKTLSQIGFDNAKSGEEAIKALMICIATISQERDALKAEVATLQSLVPHPGDGTCDRCGCGPAKTFRICESCADDDARAEAADTLQVEELLSEVQALCNKIVNSPPDTTIKGEIESIALSIGHHPLVLLAIAIPAHDGR